MTEVVKLLFTGKLDQPSAQAAAWHLQNGLTWDNWSRRSASSISTAASRRTLRRSIWSEPGRVATKVATERAEKAAKEKSPAKSPAKRSRATKWKRRIRVGRAGSRPAAPG